MQLDQLAQQVPQGLLVTQVLLEQLDRLVQLDQLVQRVQQET